METKIMGVDGLPQAVELIRKGNVVAFATETVYGLGADAFNERAVQKIFEAKGRPQDNPLIVHLSKVEDIDSVAIVTNSAIELFSIFSPGPLTIVLKRRKELPSIVSAGLDTVAVRIPSKQLARQLIEQTQVPIAAPSANISKRLSPTTAQHVYEDLKGKIPLILDGGACEVGIESTVLDLSREQPLILRPGYITKEMLLPYLPTVSNYIGADEVSPSPGVKYSHYMPIVDCVLAKTSASARAEYGKMKKIGKNPVVLGSNKFITDNSITFVDLGSSGDEIAKNLYSKLRDMEKIFDYIIIEKFAGEKIELSLRNRLIKASKGVIV